MADGELRLAAVRDDQFKPTLGNPFRNPPRHITIRGDQLQPTTTTLDGFGRTIHVQTDNGSTTVSTVDTEYAPCACSPLGKLWRFSQPYAPGATPVWTTFTYDGSGRTLTLTAPDGVSTTHYAYEGSYNGVTDPAGKSNTSVVDAFGNLVALWETDPALGNVSTNYTYNALNQLTTVSMTRGTVTQTRTFTYVGAVIGDN